MVQKNNAHLIHTYKTNTALVGHVLLHYCAAFSLYARQVFQAVAQIDFSTCLAHVYHKLSEVCAHFSHAHNVLQQVHKYWDHSFMAHLKTRQTMQNAAGHPSRQTSQTRCTSQRVTCPKRQA